MDMDKIKEQFNTIAKNITIIKNIFMPKYRNGGYSLK
jgi:hypothetical protein